MASVTVGGCRPGAPSSVIWGIGFYVLVAREHNIHYQRALAGVLTAALLLRGARLKN